MAPKPFSRVSDKHKLDPNTNVITWIPGSSLSVTGIPLIHIMATFTCKLFIEDGGSKPYS